MGVNTHTIEQDRAGSSRIEQDRAGSSRIKYPPTLLLICIFYILFPILNLLFIAIQFKVWSYRALFYVSPFGYVLMVLAPVIGIGLLRLKKWAYFLFLIHAVAILCYNFLLAFSKGALYYETTLMRSTIGLGLLWFFLRKEISAPYLNIISRGFRKYKRHLVKVGIQHDKQRFLTRDLTCDGCFLYFNKNDQIKTRNKRKTTTKSTFIPGELLKLQIKTDLKVHPISGRVVRLTSEGVAIRFVKTSRQVKKELRKFLDTYFPIRYDLCLPIELSQNKKWISGESLDFSEKGLYFLTPSTEQKIDKGKVDVEISVNGNRYCGTGEIAWVNKQGNFGKPSGYGVHLNTITHKRRFRHAIRKYLKEQNSKGERVVAGVDK